MPLPPPPTESSDYVTTDTFRWLLGIFGAILAGAWALAMKMITGRASSAELKAHLKEDDDRFDALNHKIDDQERRTREDMNQLENAVRDGFRDIRNDIFNALKSVQASK